MLGSAPELSLGKNYLARADSFKKKLTLLGQLLIKGFLNNLVLFDTCVS